MRRRLQRRSGERTRRRTCLAVASALIASLAAACDDAEPDAAVPAVTSPTVSGTGGPNVDVPDTTVVPATTGPADPAPTEAGGSQEAELAIAESADLTAPTLSVRDARFPLVISEDGQQIVDQDGVPFLIQGDAAWSLIAQLDMPDVDLYLDTRRAQGFNTLVVNLIEHKFSDDPPRDVLGNEPFSTEGDFTTPNPEYFDRAAEIIGHAADRGFAVLLAPAYLGWMGGDEGWYVEMTENGVDALREYGGFVGERFAGLQNVIWLLGGDYTPPDEGVELVDAVQEGLVQGGAQQLRTAHWSPEWSAVDIPVDWLDINTTYTYDLVYELSVADDQRSGALPHFLIESKYEQDNFETTPQWVRAQAYYALLTGAVGQVYGHGDVWQFRDGWREALDSTGTGDMVRVRALWDQIPWTELTFDIDQRIVVDGAGDYGTEDFAAAASTTDGAMILVYVPTDRDAVELDLGPVGPVTIRWYDPTAGTYRLAEATVVDSRRVHIEHPGHNAASDMDWVLVIERPV